MPSPKFQSDVSVRGDLDLRLEDFFNGQCKAWGIFETRGGRLKNQFTVLTDGTWNGEQLELKERVFYANGSRDERIWAIIKTGHNTYEGLTDGLQTKARGTVTGSHFQWKYRLSWRYKGRGWLTHFDDQMWLQDKNTLINRAIISKYGLKIGQAWLFFRRATADPIP